MAISGSGPQSAWAATRASGVTPTGRNPQRHAHLVIAIDDYVVARELEHDFMASKTFDETVTACLTSADGANSARDPSVTAMLVAEHCVLGGIESLRRSGVRCPVFALTGALTKEQRARLVATGYEEAVRLSDLNQDLIDSIVLLALQIAERRSSLARDASQRLGDGA